MSNLPSLFKISQDISELVSELDYLQQSEIEIPPSLEERLSQALIHSEQKVTSYCLALSHIESEINWMKAQVKDAQNFIKRKEAHLERLLRLAHLAMQVQGVKELGGEGSHKLLIRKSKRVEISDESSIPMAYMKVETVFTPDKIGIKKAIEAGETIEGCSIIENETVHWK